MRYRNLHNTPFKISELGLGTWTLTTGWWGTYAWAGRTAGVKVTDVMPAAAVRAKVEACIGYGARVVLKGAHIDLSLSIQGRAFKEADGKYNFPDGEIFTGPVEDSAEGWVRFSYPAIYDGQEVVDVDLWFEGGRVVR